MNAEAVSWWVRSEYERSNQDWHVWDSNIDDVEERWFVANGGVAEFFTEKYVVDREKLSSLTDTWGRRVLTDSEIAEMSEIIEKRGVKEGKKCNLSKNALIALDILLRHTGLAIKSKIYSQPGEPFELKIMTAGAGEQEWIRKTSWGNEDARKIEMSISEIIQEAKGKFSFDKTRSIRANVGKWNRQFPQFALRNEGVIRSLEFFYDKLRIPNTTPSVTVINFPKHGFAALEIFLNAVGRRICFVDVTESESDKVTCCIFKAEKIPPGERGINSKVAEQLQTIGSWN